jgi:hypothetical protein
VEHKRIRYFNCVIVGLLVLAVIFTATNKIVESNVLGSIAKWFWFFGIFGLPVSVWLTVAERISDEVFAILLVTGGATATVFVHVLSFTLSDQGLVIALRRPLHTTLDPLVVVLLYATVSYLFAKMNRSGFKHRAPQSPSGDY